MQHTRYHLAYADNLDARCATAVVRYWAAQQGETNVLTYPLPSTHLPGKHADLLTRIKAICRDRKCQKSLEFGDHEPESEQIFLIGSSLPEEEIELLDTWGKLTYINHLEPFFQVRQRKYSSCGSATGTGKSTCEIAWSFLLPQAPLPLCVQLIGRRTMHIDTDHTLWADEILPFIYAMDSVNTDPGDGWDEWEKLFETLASSHVRKRINEGKTILRYLLAQERRAARQKRDAEYAAEQAMATVTGEEDDNV